MDVQFIRQNLFITLRKSLGYFPMAISCATVSRKLIQDCINAAIPFTIPSDNSNLGMRGGGLHLCNKIYTLQSNLPCFHYPKLSWTEIKFYQGLIQGIRIHPIIDNGTYIVGKNHESIKNGIKII